MATAHTRRRLVVALLCDVQLASGLSGHAMQRSSSAALAEATQLLFRHDSLLGVASRLFDEPTQKAFTAVYAWCRRADEIVDSPHGSPSAKRELLLERRSALAAMYRGQPRDALDGLLLETVERYPGLTQELFSAMLDGMETDTTETVRYDTWPQLERYCYCVAGVVGELSLPILGVDDRKIARGPAVSLGNAVQLVNILRDISADATLGRVYLPREDLDRFGVREEELLDTEAGALSDRGRSLVQFEADRARALIADGIAGIPLLPRNVRFAVRAIAELHIAMLDELEAQRFDSLAKRVRLSMPAKLAVVARLALTETAAALANSVGRPF